MTNLDRLLGSDLLFDNVVSFVTRWAEGLEASGIADSDGGTRFESSLVMPRALRQFYELKSRRPFLQLGLIDEFSSSPFVEEDGLIRFCRFAVEQNEDSKLWFEGTELKRYTADLFLAQSVLSSLARYPLGLHATPSQGPNAFAELEPNLSLVLSCESDGLRNQGKKAWWWGADGILLEEPRSEGHPFFYLGVSSQSLAEELIEKGWRPEGYGEEDDDIPF